ncbi:hypothetical protein CSOJ01_02423 [Colletotrichum sojae]|uniref:Uncharacterized protein n=1 Tax=Colletotrichum sojae TaxID=2175907 RepID=A0A8H6N2U8_9PEZI|nr:hypothetical protein CSOJ01_02423 [Colletotrichum sojae]
MSLLPGYLLLLIAERAAFAEIQSLRATCKTNRELLDDYEHSVTKANISRHPCPPCCHVLSSDTREREVLPRDTFDIIRELETRERHIEEVIDSAYIAFRDDYNLQDLSQDEMEIVRANLTRALWQCSEIADLETHSIRYSDGVVPKRDPAVKSLIHQEIMLRDAPPPDGWHFALREVHEFNREDTRARQIDYIRKLSPQDLAGIAALAYLANQGYMRYRSPSGRGMSRPEVMELGVCAAENTIRHGVFFLHTKLRAHMGGSDDEDASHHANLLLDDAWCEMKQWESGDSYAQPGLNMTVTSTLCEKIGCKQRRDAMKAACTMLKGGMWKEEPEGGEGDGHEKADGEATET